MANANRQRGSEIDSVQEPASAGSRHAKIHAKGHSSDRKLGRTVLGGAALLMVGGLWWAPASSAQVATFHFVGTVKDADGLPLGGAVISDGSQAATTGADGTYDLPETATGTFTLNVSRPHSRDAVASVTVVSPVNPATGTNSYPENFTLLYLITGSLDHPYISTANGPATATLTTTSWAPNPGVASAGGSCVSVSDSRTHVTAAATLDSSNPDGSSTWTFALTGLVQGSPEGVQSLSYTADDCATSSAVSVTDSFGYVIDNTPPTVTSTFPTGVTTASPIVGATVSDSGSGVNAATLAIDGVNEPATYNQANGRLSYQASGLSAGTHTVSVAASDWAGNPATVTFKFGVDNTAPTLSGPSPTGTVATCTPTISVTATDADSGINPSSIVMTLTGAAGTSTLSPSFDPSTGIISYQVPASPQGAGVGQSPLLDGSYTVKVSVSDPAGNASNTSWSFTVKTAPPTGLKLPVLSPA